MVTGIIYDSVTFFYETMKQNDKEQEQEEKELAWHLKERKHLVKDQWIDLHADTFRMPDGSEVGPFYTYAKKDYCVIVARDTNGNYITVRQFRQGIQRLTTEFPAGGIEEGEDPLQAARRELQEETGYVSDKWKQIIAVPSDATLCENTAYIFKADDCVPAGKQSLDRYEFMHVCTMHEDDIKEAITQGDFAQAMHIMSFYLAREQ